MQDQIQMSSGQILHGFDGWITPMPKGLLYDRLKASGAGPQWFASLIGNLWDGLHYKTVRLHQAVMKNQVLTLKRMAQTEIKLGNFSIDAAKRFGLTPLMIALRYQKAEAALSLLELGANPDVRDVAGYTPLLVHCTPPIHLEDNLHAELLAKLVTPISVTDKTHRQESPLLLLAKANQVKSLQSLLSMVADAELRHTLIQSPDLDGMTPLMYAAWNNRSDTVRLLLEQLPDSRHMAYILRPNRWGRTALDIAAHWREKSALFALKEFLPA